MDDLQLQLKRALVHAANYAARAEAAISPGREELLARTKFYLDLASELRALIAGTGTPEAH